jgi:pentatricopeptide repeat protein
MNDHGPQDRPHLLMWLAYCYFHNGDYKKAIDAYDDAMRKAGGCWVLDGAPNYLV